MSNVTRSACQRFKGKICLLVGATTGIGLAAAKRLGEEGGHVVISSRSQHNIDAALETLVSSNISADGFPCNVSNDSQRRALVSYVMNKHKRIDVFVNVAGVNPSAPNEMADVLESVYDKIMDVNVKSAVMMSQLVIPHIKETRGNILFVSSLAAYNPLKLQGTYSMSKTNLLSLTKILASELGPSGVRVNCIAPGLIKTKFSEVIWSNDDLMDYVLSTVSLGRVGYAEDCAGAVAFLCSDDAAYITGEVMGINGGIQARL